MYAVSTQKYECRGGLRLRIALAFTFVYIKNCSFILIDVKCFSTDKRQSCVV